MAAHHGHIALVQSQTHGSGYVSLRALDKGVEGLAQRSEPQAVVCQFGIFQPDVLLEVGDIALQAESLQFPMRRNQQGSARSLITATRLDAYKPVLDQIDAA